MHTVLLVVQIIIIIALIGIILIQRSSADGLSGLGGGGGGGGGNALFSSRASANILTRTTAILAALFMINSLALGILASRSPAAKSLLDQYKIEQPATPVKPASPAVPIAE